MKPLQQQWQKLSTRLDAMSLRERALVFGAVTATLLALLYSLAAEPLLARQAALQSQIRQQEQQVASLDLEITARAQGFVADPDAQDRQRLQQVQGDIERISTRLLAVQKGLVAPDRIAAMLGHILRGNGKLKLVSLKTLPVSGMNEAAAGTAVSTTVSAAAAAPATASAAAGAPGGATGAPTPAPPHEAAAVLASTMAAAGTAAPAGQDGQPQAVAKPRELLYRHGVEVVLSGSYLDMVDYMAALEALPEQLFWGSARLEAQQYPQARLTLTLYTLSLDEQWMKL